MKGLNQTTPTCAASICKENFNGKDTNYFVSIDYIFKTEKTNSISQNVKKITNFFLLVFHYKHLMQSSTAT